MSQPQTRLVKLGWLVAPLYEDGIQNKDPIANEEEQSMPSLAILLRHLQ